MKNHIQTTLILLFCGCLATTAADVDAIRAEVREGRSMLRTAKHDEGLTILNRAATTLEQHLKQNPKDFKAAYELGMTFYFLDNDERALASYARAAKLNPKIWQPWLFTGLIHSYANDFEKGEAAFLEASRLAPNNADIQYELGMLYYSAEKDKKSIASFKKALSMDPEHQKASYELAMKYMDPREMEKVYPRRAARAAAQTNDTHTLYNFGQLCQNMGKTKESLKAFKRVAELDPTEWRAVEKLVQLNQALGNMEERDVARQMVFDLRTSGKVKVLKEEPLYIRDQFRVEGQLVMALEYFEMKGERAIRYSFVITDEAGKNGKYRITLGSYDPTNDYAERQGKNKPGERTFHLDGYYADGAHRTFNFFRGEPDYDTVKKQVVEILNGERKSISSTTPTPATN